VSPPRSPGARQTRETASDDLQVDLAYTALDVYIERNIGFAVGPVDVRVAHPLESLGVDLAQSSLGFRLEGARTWLRRPRVRGLIFFQIPEDKKPKVFVIFTQRAFQNAQIVKSTI
jgi:hypothetical protein